MMGMAMGGGGALRGRTLRYVTPRTRRKSYRPRPGPGAPPSSSYVAFPYRLPGCENLCLPTGRTHWRLRIRDNRIVSVAVRDAVARQSSPSRSTSSGSWNPALVAWSQPSRWVSSPFRKERQRSAAQRPVAWGNWRWRAAARTVAERNWRRKHDEANEFPTWCVAG